MNTGVLAALAVLAVLGTHAVVQIFTSRLGCAPRRFEPLRAGHRSPYENSHPCIAPGKNQGGIGLLRPSVSQGFNINGVACSIARHLAISSRALIEYDCCGRGVLIDGLAGSFVESSLHAASSIDAGHPPEKS